MVAGANWRLKFFVGVKWKNFSWQVCKLKRTDRGGKCEWFVASYYPGRHSEKEAAIMAANAIARREGLETIFRPEKKKTLS